MIYENMWAAPCEVLKREEPVLGEFICCAISSALDACWELDQNLNCGKTAI